MIVESVEDVIYLSGDLTQDHWNTIRTAAALALKHHPTGVIIDLSQIDRFTPEGAETFLHALRYIETGEARVILANAPDHVRQTLSHVPGVRSQLPIATSINEARESLDLLPQTDKKRPPVIDPVLVALSGEPVDEDALEMAAGIARQRSTSICIAYLIEVPRSLAITAPLPEAESRAKQALANAEQVCRKLGLSPKCTAERVRDGYLGLVEVADKFDAQLIFVVLRQGERNLEEVVQSLHELLHRTKREVLMYRGPST